MRQPPLFPDDDRPQTVYQLHQKDEAERASSTYFDGDTYEPGQDKFRLLTELQRVWVVMRDGQWHTLKGIASAVGGSEAGVSARLRDFRKARFGGHTVERDRVKGGLFVYCLIANGPLRCPGEPRPR